MEHSQNITSLIKLVGQAAPTTEDQYPVLKKMEPPYEELTFNLGHSARHLAMSAGKINKVIHDVEHGDKMDFEIFKKQMFSTMFTLCKMCELIGMNGDDLVNGTADLANSYKDEFEKNSEVNNS